jgi:hypothetical protein
LMIFCAVVIAPVSFPVWVGHRDHLATSCQIKS